MSYEEIISPIDARARKNSGAGFRRAEARGPIIDQDGREVRPESLGPQSSGSQFEFGHSGANPFANLTREQRLARLHALSKLLDMAFILPGTKIRYGIDGLIGLIPVVGDIITTAISLWVVREARASARPGTSRRGCSAMSRSMAWSGWCRWQATPSTSCSAPTSATCECCSAGWTSSRASAAPEAALAPGSSNRNLRGVRAGVVAGGLRLGGTRAALKREILAFIQRADAALVEAGLVDLQVRAVQRIRRQFLDRKANRFGCSAKSPIGETGPLLLRIAAGIVRRQCCN